VVVFKLFFKQAVVEEQFIIYVNFEPNFDRGLNMVDADISLGKVKGFMVIIISLIKFKIIEALN
jgi:hypothetical protein